MDQVRPLPGPHRARQSRRRRKAMLTVSAMAGETAWLEGHPR
jgi:hypothetical protein